MKEGKTMTKAVSPGKPAFLGALLLAAAITAGANDVFMLPTSNILWRTAPSSDFEVPVLMPPGASSATLVVTGRRYRREWTGLADGQFRISLPAADSADAENVYDLTLTFNDYAATTCHAKLAVVQGAATGGTAEAEVRTPGSGWSSFAATAVLPIPSGVDAVSVNGQAVNASLWQSPGWYLLAARSGSLCVALLDDGGEPSAEATLQGAATGLTVIVW